MEGLANRMATNHLLSAPQNVTVQPHYGGIPMSQQRDRLPPSYEEAQFAAQQNADIQQINNMEAEKHAIYRHPLFPLLGLLFEKCEQTTATSECPPCSTFDNEIKDFIIQHNREGKPFFTEDADLNTLVRRKSATPNVVILRAAFCKLYFRGKNTESVPCNPTN